MDSSTSNQKKKESLVLKILSSWHFWLVLWIVSVYELISVPATQENGGSFAAIAFILGYFIVILMMYSIIYFIAYLMVVFWWKTRLPRRTLLMKACRLTGVSLLRKVACSEATNKSMDSSTSNQQQNESIVLKILSSWHFWFVLWIFSVYELISVPPTQENGGLFAAIAFILGYFIVIFAFILGYFIVIFMIYRIIYFIRRRNNPK